MVLLVLISHQEVYHLHSFDDLDGRKSDGADFKFGEELRGKINQFLLHEIEILIAFRF